LIGVNAWGVRRTAVEHPKSVRYRLLFRRSAELAGS